MVLICWFVFVSNIFFRFLIRFIICWICFFKYKCIFVVIWLLWFWFVWSFFLIGLILLINNFFKFKWIFLYWVENVNFFFLVFLSSVWRFFLICDVLFSERILYFLSIVICVKLFLIFFFIRCWLNEIDVLNLLIYCLGCFVKCFF